MWNNDTISHLKIIQLFSEKIHLLIKDGDGEIVRTNKSYGNTLNLMEIIPTLLKTMCRNDNWMKQKQYSSLGKILFENGYYDFKEEKFYSKEEYGIIE